MYMQTIITNASTMDYSYHPDYTSRVTPERARMLIELQSDDIDTDLYRFENVRPDSNDWWVVTIGSSSLDDLHRCVAYQYDRLGTAWAESGAATSIRLRVRQASVPWESASAQV
jgi:hypothetical protein